MSQFIGMNVESITATVVPGLKTQSEAVRTVIGEVERIIGVVQNDWRGDDSRMFIEKWQSEYRSPLQRLAEELNNLASIANSNAEAQRQQSSTL